MAQLPLAVVSWLAAHHGTISHKQLVRRGLSPDQIYRRVLSGRLVRCHDGVYRSGEWPDSELTRCVAACLAVPPGLVSLRTAARLWGLRRCAGAAIDLTVPEPVRTRVSGVDLHRTTMLPASHAVRRSDGIRLTSPMRTACDLAAVLDEEDLASVIDQVLDQHRVRYTTFLRMANDLTRRGWPGGRRLRAVIDGRSVNAAPHDSHLKVVLARALVRAGLPDAVRQQPIEILPAILVHVDLAYPDARLVIEVDHRSWHSGEQAALDKRRDRLVRIAGFDTVRVTDDDLRHRMSETVEQLVTIHRLSTKRCAA